MGALTAMGFDVQTVTPATWKKGVKLAGKQYTKDDSREAASRTFPALKDNLRLKKHHGRAEAALIAAYGLGVSVRRGADAEEKALEAKAAKAEAAARKKRAAKEKADAEAKEGGKS